MTNSLGLKESGQELMTPFLTSYNISFHRLRLNKSKEGFDLALL